MKNKKIKLLVVMASVLLLVGAVIPTTLAFLMDSTQPVSNVFQSSRVGSLVIEESFNGSTKSGVTVQNTGNTDAWIRAAIIVTWKDGVNGNVYGSAPAKNTDYTIQIGGDWLEGADGFYYYKSPVAGGGSTTNLIVTCSPVAGRTPEGYGLNVEILSSALQSKPDSTFNTVWASSGLTASADSLS